MPYVHKRGGMESSSSRTSTPPALIALHINLSSICHSSASQYHRRTSCRNCFGVGRVHIPPDALRFQLHCRCRVSRKSWSTLQCGKAWWLVPCMVFCYSCFVIWLKWLLNKYFLAVLNKQSALVAAHTAARQVVSLGRALVVAI